MQGGTAKFWGFVETFIDATSETLAPTTYMLGIILSVILRRNQLSPPLGVKVQFSSIYNSDEYISHTHEYFHTKLGKYSRLDNPSHDSKFRAWALHGPLNHYISHTSEHYATKILSHILWPVTRHV